MVNTKQDSEYKMDLITQSEVLPLMTSSFFGKFNFRMRSSVNYFYEINFRKINIRAGFFGKFTNIYLHEIYLIFLSPKIRPREICVEACFRAVSDCDIFQECDIFHVQII